MIGVRVLGDLIGVKGFLSSREFAPLLDEVQRDGVTGQDYKSALQELLQSRDMRLQDYRIVGTAGPDHRKLFEIEVGVRGEPLASAPGASKKEAEQEAACAALEKLKKS